MAVIYALGGVSAYTTVLFPLLCGLILINLLYVFAWREGRPIEGLLAALFTGTNFYFLYFTKNLYPDLPLALFVFTALFGLHKARSSRGKKEWGWMILTAGFFLWAFCMKETAVFAFVFVPVLMAYDVWKKQHLPFWGKMTVVFLIWGGMYLLTYYLIYGDPLFRLKAIIENGHYESADSYFDKSFSQMIPRLTYEPLLMLINSGLIIPLLFVASKGIAIFREDRPSLYWLAAGMTSLFSFWWLSTSWQYYNPLALFPRHLLLLIPLFSVPAARMLITGDQNYFIRLLVLSFLCGFICWQTSGFKLFLIYGLLGGWSFVQVVNRRYSIFSQYLIRAGFVVVYLIHPVYSTWKGEEKGFKALQATFESKLITVSPDTKVYTDEMLAHGGPFFYGFDEQAPRFYSFDSLGRYPKGGTSYLILHSYHLKYLAVSEQSVLEKVKEEGLGAEVIAQSDQLTVYQLSCLPISCNKE